MEDNRDGNEEIYYKQSTIGVSLGSRFTSDKPFLTASTNPAISIFGTMHHVIWDDDRDGNYEIYYNVQPMEV